MYVNDSDKYLFLILWQYFSATCKPNTFIMIENTAECPVEKGLVPESISASTCGLEGK